MHGSKKIIMFIVFKIIYFNHTRDISNPCLLTHRLLISFQSSRPCTKRGSSSNEDIPFKRLKIKDKTSSISVALWRDMSFNEIRTGSYVRLLNFNRTSTYDKRTNGQKPVLANLTGSSLEVSPLYKKDAEKKML